MDADRKVRRKAVAAKVVLLSGLALAAPTAMLLWLSHPLSGKFDPELWKASPQRRGRMADDLVARGGLVGMTPPEVSAMLNSPDLREVLTPSEERLGYMLPGRGLAADPREWGDWYLYLEVRDGRVAEVYLADVDD
jgi:hypothetical protein